MFSECSAKTGENVDFIFNELIKNIYILNTEGREEFEERKRREEKAKKNLKILNKYLSF